MLDWLACLPLPTSCSPCLCATCPVSLPKHDNDPACEMIGATWVCQEMHIFMSERVTLAEVPVMTYVLVVC